MPIMTLAAQICAFCAPRGRLRQGSLVYFLGFGRPVQAAERTSVADEPAPDSAAMSAPRTCWDRVRGCPAVVDSDLSEGVDAGLPTLWQEAAAASAAGSSSDPRWILKRHDHGRPGDGTHASGPPMNAPPKPKLLALGMRNCAMTCGDAGPGRCCSGYKKPLVLQPYHL